MIETTSMVLLLDIIFVGNNNKLLFYTYETGWKFKYMLML